MKLPSGILRSFWRTAFPSVCVECGGLVDEGHYENVCPTCASRFQVIDDPKCLTCGFPFFGSTESADHCMHCEHLDPSFGQGWSIALFRGPLRAIIHDLKYEDGFWALEDIRNLVETSPGLERFLEGATIIPVPLHPRKLRERGYNQSALIAKVIVSQIPGTGYWDGLKRIVDTVSQTQFNRSERIRNLKNAFEVSTAERLDTKNRYVVVDDVFTTGSTLNACAAALRRAGARDVDVLTIGHG